MDTTKLGLLAAASALALPNIAPPATAAAVAPVAPARTYAQLLEPIPNAVERLKASDSELTVQHYLTPVQYRHRYRRYWRGRWIYYWGPWAAPPVYYYGYPYPYYHHHHHHHHHHNHF